MQLVAPDCDDAFLPAGQAWQVALLVALVAAEAVPDGEEARKRNNQPTTIGGGMDS